MNGTKTLAWIILSSTLINITCSALDCSSFNSRWKKDGNQRTWGNQKISELRTGRVLLLTVNCSYEPIDEEVVLCTITDNSPISLLSLIRCQLSNIDMGTFLGNKPVQNVQVLNNGPRRASINMIFHEKTKVSKIELNDIKTNGAFTIKVINETVSVKEITVSSYDFTDISSSTNWKLFSNLKDVSITNGRLTTFSPILPQSLKILILENNQLEDISPQTFSNLPNLELLSLTHNKFTKIDDKIFRKLTSLKTLKFAMNRLSAIGTFKLKSLVAFDLSSNQLTTLRRGTFDMEALGELNLSTNQISSIQRGTFGSKGPSTLDLSGNKLAKMDEGAFDIEGLEFLKLSDNPDIVLTKTNPFGTSKALKRVEALSCKLKHLPNIHGKRNKEITMDFSNNEMVNVTLPLYSNSKKIVVIDNNNIVTIIVNSNFAKGTYDDPVSYSLLTNAPVCNCSLWSFLEFLQQPIANTTFPGIGKLKCKSGQPVKDVIKTLFCPGIHCPDLCKCDKVLNCSHVGLYVAPSSVPLNLTKVYLDNNQVKTLSNTESLYWNHVTHLYLSNNKLISLDDWDIPISLKLLAIDNNQLEIFPPSLLQKVNSVPDFTIFLSRNNWKCNCTEMVFMKDNAAEKKIVDSDNTTCSIFPPNNNTSVRFKISDIPIYDFCPSSRLGVYIIISIALLMIICLTIAYFVYRFREEIILILSSRNFFSKPVKSNKEYDALVIYNEADYEKVNEMIRHLETKNRLFIPGRNAPREGITASDVAEWIQKSRVVLLLMTEESLQSTEFQQQCQVALKQKKQKNIQALVPVMCGDLRGVLRVLMEDSIREIILTESNHLLWGEKWFWQKLRLALRREGAEKWKRLRFALKM